MKEIELKVEGMSCGGCEARIQKVLQELDCVGCAQASHTEKTVKVTLKDETKIDEIKETIEDLGFEVVE